MNYTKIDFSQRNVGIDLFRALTMFVMIFVNDFWKIHDVPRWLDHAKRGEDFLGLADVVFLLQLGCQSLLPLNGDIVKECPENPLSVIFWHAHWPC